MQDWPALMMRESAATRAASSRSASASTRHGSEPPSSSTAGLISLAAIEATTAPARSEPVKDTAWMRGSRITCSTSAVAAWSVWNTPSGAPTARNASSIAAAQPGTWGSCFITAVFPAMSAGAAKRKASQNGAFHGSTPSTVPSGRCWT